MLNIELILFLFCIKFCGGCGFLDLFQVIIGLIMMIVGTVIIIYPEFATLIALILVIVGVLAIFDATYVSNN